MSCLDHDNVMTSNEDSTVKGPRGRRSQGEAKSLVKSSSANGTVQNEAKCEGVDSKCVYATVLDVRHKRSRL